MQAFVTGSTGLLGNNLVRLLIQQGYSVKALVRSRQKAEALFADLPVNIIIGDMQDVAGFASELAGCDVLFHTAAYFREYYQPGDHWQQLQDINIKGTIALLEEAEKQGVKRVIYTSSSNVIGSGAHSAPGDETTRVTAEQCENLYAKSKVLAEKAIDDFLRSHTLPVVLILPSGMFGPGDSAPTSSGQLVLNFLRRRLPGIVDGGMSVVDARDVAQAMLTAVEKGRSGERYIVSARYCSMEDLLKVLESVSGIPAPGFHIPYIVMLLYATIAEVVGRLTGKPVLVTRSSVGILHRRHNVLSTRAIKELAATFRPLSETLSDEIAWYRAHQYV